MPNVCYANSFLLTDVVRTLLLFYNTPVWAALIDRFVLKHTIPRQRYLPLALALSGVWVVFGQHDGLLYLYGCLVALLLSWLLRDQLGPIPQTADILSMLPFLAILVVFLLMPTNASLIWSPTRIGAGTFGILILAEIVLGFISAALWADEVFGWREVLGCLLMIAAGLTGALASRSKQPNTV